MASNRVIGRDNRLPWHIPEDLKRFKRLTRGHPVIMGRKTFQSIIAMLGNPLPDRENIILTRSDSYAAPGARVAHSLDDALAAANPGDEHFVIGGAEIYAMALPVADRLYLTEIDAVIEGDAVFPEFDRTHWEQVSREKHGLDGTGGPRYDFAIYLRRDREPD